MTITADPPTPQQHRRSRSPVTWIVVAVGVVALLAVGGPFVYIHLLSGDTPAPLTLSSTPSSAAAPSSTTAGSGAAGTPGAATLASLGGSYAVASGSQAGYRVSEVLLGQSTEAVGRTSSVTGTATIAGNQVTAADVAVDMTSVTSDKSQRDQQFQTRIMDTSTYPTATFRLTSPIDLTGLPTDGSTGSTNATGTLTLHGTSRTITIPLQVKTDGSGIDVQASLPITFSDYGIDNPSAGPAQVGDTGTLELLVKLAKS